MGYFCYTIYCWELIKIAQSGHTGRTNRREDIRRRNKLTDRLKNADQMLNERVTKEHQLGGCEEIDRKQEIIE